MESPRGVAKTVRQKGEHGHSFVQARFQLPTICRLCQTYIWGLGKNGYECRVCRYPVHAACIDGVPNNCFKAYLESTRIITQSIQKGTVPLIHLNAVTHEGTKEGKEGKEEKKEKDKTRDRERTDLHLESRGGKDKERIDRGDRTDREKDKGRDRDTKERGESFSSEGASASPREVPKGRQMLMEPMRGLPKESLGAVQPQMLFPYDVLHKPTSPKGRRADMRAIAAELNPDLANNTTSEGSLYHSTSPSRSPSPRGSMDASDLTQQLENLSLEATRLRYKTKFVSRRIEEVIQERSTLEAALAQAAAERERLRFALSHAEFGVASAYEQLKGGVHSAAEALAKLSEQSEACGTHFTRMTTLMGMSAERISAKQVAALQTAGLKLEELMGAHALLRVHNNALQRQKLRLREHNNELSRRVAALNGLQSEVAAQAVRANNDAAQLNAVGVTLASLHAHFAELTVQTLPSRTLQSLLHDLNTAMQAFSSPLEPVAGGIGALRPVGEENDQLKWMGQGLERQLKAATVNALIERLTSDSAPEHDFTRRFLLCHPLFLSPLDLLEKLVVRFCVTPALRAAALAEAKQQQQPIRLRVLAALKAWLESYGDDWRSDLFEMARGFLENTVRPAGLVTSADSILALLNKRERDAPTPPPREHLSVIAIAAPPMSDPAELARQLTLRAFDLFSRLQPRELLYEAATRHERSTRRLVALLASSRQVTGWAIATVLQASELPARQAKISFIIRVAYECLLLHNYQSCADLIAALASPPIARLRVTWEGVKDLQKEYAAMGALFPDNYRQLHTHMTTAKPPCVPYVGQVLADLTALMEGTPDMLHDSFVNWYKLDLVAEAIFHSISYQTSLYAIQLHVHVVSYVFDHQVYSPEQADELSAALEL